MTHDGGWEDDPLGGHHDLGGGDALDPHGTGDGAVHGPEDPVSGTVGHGTVGHDPADPADPYGHAWPAPDDHGVHDHDDAEGHDHGDAGDHGDHGDHSDAGRWSFAGADGTGAGHHDADLADHVDHADPWAGGTEHPAPAHDDLAQPVDAHGFPPHVDLADVAPHDGRDWIDAGLLGGGDGPDHPPPAGHPLVATAPEAELLSDVHHADGGDGTGSWAGAAGSDDPAVRALAYHWGPAAGS